MQLKSEKRKALDRVAEFERNCSVRKATDVIDIPPVLYAEDVCRICRFSDATLNRRLKEGCFPLPLDTGGTKRCRRIWSRDSIKRFLAGQGQINVKTETPTRRKQRADVARAELERRGVRVNAEK